MALIPRKTYPELTALTAPVVDGDVLAAYRSPGPLRRLTASTFADYIKAFFSASGGSALVGNLLSGTGPVARTVSAKLGDYAHFEDFLPTSYNPATDDCSTELATAATWSAANKKAVVFSGYYRIANCATITSDNFWFHFNGTRFDVLDTGASGTLNNGGTGKIGILFKGCDNIQLTGSAAFYGQGTLGSTALGGIVFDSCTSIQAPFSTYFDKMAGGMFVLWSSYGEIGPISAYRMNGTQVFDSGTAGTALIMAGAYTLNVASVNSRENYKPIVYLSVATAPMGARTDNENVNIGPITGTASSPANESSVLSIRSALGCTFGLCSGTGFSSGVIITRYASDSASTGIQRNVIAGITGSFASTSASVDSAFVQELGDVGAPAIGHTAVGMIDVVCAGENGVNVSTGKVTFGSVRVNGSTRPVELKGSGSTSVTFSVLEVLNQNQEAVSIGQGADVSIGLLDNQSGSIGGVSGAARYDATLPGGSGGRGAIIIENFKYRFNSIGSDVLWPYLDLTSGSGPKDALILHIDGTGTIGQARWSLDTFKVDRSRFLINAAPTAGTFTTGDFIYNDTPAIDGNNMVILGWNRLTNGSGTVVGTDWAISRTSTVSPAT